MKKFFKFGLFLCILILTLQGCKVYQKEIVISNVSINENGTVHIEGRARAFEGNVNIEIRDEEGNICFNGFTTTNAKDPSQFGAFTKGVTLSLFPQTEHIIVKCFIISPKDGTVSAKEEERIAYNIDYQLVNIYLVNTVKNPEMLDCKKVYPVKRKIMKNSKNPAIDTLKLLINGPDEKEKNQGYATSGIPQNITINYIKVKDKSVQADFGEEFLTITGGSCKVQSVRAEIEQTVKQFYPDYEIIISANGNSEGILQP